MKKFFLAIIVLFVLKTGFSQTNYTFTGNGYWSVAANWAGNTIPPVILSAGSSIYISPAVGDTCVLDVVQKISGGASLVISSGAVFIVSGDINNSVPLITTAAISSIRAYDAVTGGNVLDDGGTPVFERGVVWSTSHNPTIYDNKVVNGTGTGSFTINIQGITSSTTYYVRAFAKNSTGIGYGNELSFTTPSISSVVICDQEWTTANLDVVTYRNGDTIPQVTSQAQWDTMTTGAWCYYGFYPANYYTGKFYNAAAVNDPRGLAPAGWHLPCDSEWKKLINCLGGIYDAGAKMRDTGTRYWLQADPSFDNSSGFTALGAGRYTTNNSDPIHIPLWDYYHYEFGPGPQGWVNDPTFKKYAFWWSSTEAATPGSNLYHYLFLEGYQYLASTVSLPHDAFAIRCVKGDVNPVCNTGPTTVATDSVTGVTHNTAIGWGNITDSLNTNFVTERGFVWDTVSNPTVQHNKITSGSGNGHFTANLAGLSGNKTYYVRAYAINSKGTSYGGQVIFKTSPPILPTVETWFIENSGSTATSGGKITNDGGAAITAKGIVWSAGQHPTVADHFTTDGAGSETYKSHIEGLTANTTYYIRAYVTNAAGIGYGNEIRITTAATLPASVILCGNTWMQKNLDVAVYRNGDPIPQVTNTTEWESLTTGAWCWYKNDSATYGAVYGRLYNSYAVNDPRGLAPEGWHVAKNAEWSALFNCTGGGTAASNALREAGTAHWKSPNAGATNSTGFTALPGGFRMYSIYNGVPSDFSIDTGAGGYWWSAPDNNSDINKQWVIYPTIAYSYTAGKTVGYSVRCVRDSAISSDILPVVTTTAISAVTSASCTTGGNVINAGSSAVTARGVVWNTVPTPGDLSSGNKTTDGAGTGAFTSTITGLATNTKYYVWAYAVSSAGIVYGLQKTFTTLPSSIPIITTSSHLIIGNDSAQCGGAISNNYAGPQITSRGVVWSVNPNPTIGDSKTTNGSDTGSFRSKLTGLLPNTTYYLRAYATNSNGTYYGNEMNFKTFDPATPAISVCNKTWMVKNLNVSTYRNGDVIPQVTNNQEWVNLKTGAWCWYNNDSAAYAAVYGKLYNWYAVNDPRGLAPAGWHIPDDAEWNALADCLGGADVAGGALKAAGTSYWTEPNTGATNTSGFTALPGGRNLAAGVIGFDEIGISGHWWTTTDFNSSWGVTWSINNASSAVTRSNKFKFFALSVRCVHD
ncbi:MAG: fibrobacter succinogenes major paralogous domain-containing protein [Ferruginibacter sp.]